MLYSSELVHMNEENKDNWIDLAIEFGALKIDKNEFFRIMEEDFPEGTELYIDDIGEVRNGKGNYFFIDYTFRHEGIKKRVGISYSLGKEIRPNVYEVGTRTNLFKLLKDLILPEDYPIPDTININKPMLDKELLGLSFIGKVKLINGSSQDYYIIEIVKILSEGFC